MVPRYQIKELNDKWKLQKKDSCSSWQCAQYLVKKAEICLKCIFTLFKQDLQERNRKQIFYQFKCYTRYSNNNNFLFVGNENVIILNPLVWDIPALDLISKKYLVQISVVILIHRHVKGTVSVISRDTPCKNSNAWFTVVPLKPLSHWCGRYWCVFSFLIQILKGTKHRYIIHAWSNKAMKGTVVNWALSSMLVG